MTCQRAREIFPELLDRKAAAAPASSDGAAADHARARDHLAICPGCEREFAAFAETVQALDTLPSPEPSPRLRENFRALLEEEKRLLAGAAAAVAAPCTPSAPAVASRPRQRLRLLSPVIGCALLALGFFLGQRSTSSPSADAVASVPDSGSRPATVSSFTDADPATRRELAALREQIAEQRQQLDKMTTLVGYSILQQQRDPANARLEEVLVAARSENANDRVLDDLIQALTLDPSANIRLRAVEALLPHAGRDLVRAGVLAALPRERNPLVQLELIDFIAVAQDRDATPLLEKISADQSADRAVRHAAKLALARL